MKNSTFPVGAQTYHLLARHGSPTLESTRSRPKSPYAGCSTNNTETRNIVTVPCVRCKHVLENRVILRLYLKRTREYIAQYLLVVLLAWQWVRSSRRGEAALVLEGRAGLPKVRRLYCTGPNAGNAYLRRWDMSSPPSFCARIACSFSSLSFWVFNLSDSIQPCVVEIHKQRHWRKR